MLTILFRTVLIYLFVLIVMKFMGKRQIGQLQISELITTILLSELAAQPITNQNIPILYALVPVTVLLTIEVIISFAASKSARVKQFVFGKPSYIIVKGVIDQREMLKMRLSAEELLAQLRLKNISSPSQVEYAILEVNGQISVILKEADMPASRRDMKLAPEPDSSLCHCVVIDGHIINDELRRAQKTEAQILDYLVKRGYKNLKRVFLMTVTDGGDAEIVPKMR